MDIHFQHGKDAGQQVPEEVLSTVYLLWHSRELEDFNTDDKLIGVYSSAEMAEAARQRKLQYPGFCDFPDSFEICDYTIDEDSWPEGFTLPHDLPSRFEVLPDGSPRGVVSGKIYGGAAEQPSKPTRPLPHLRLVVGSKKDEAPE